MSLGSRENLSLEIRKNGARSEREEAKDDSFFHLVADKMSGPFIEKQASQRRNW